jgi:hypothetical protein
MFGVLTRSMRVLPDFIIIGAQRCGSTSLYNYLAEQSGMIPGLMKEVHFFDNNYSKGVRWYRSFFPLSTTMKNRWRANHLNSVTGEATPNYLFHPHAPKRVHATLPDVKLIVLLRNPVERAYSHYQHEVRLGVEDLSFTDAIEREKSTIPVEKSKILENETYLSFSYQNYSYLSRGRYVEQLELWNKYFAMEKILVLKSEDLFSRPAQVLEKACDFLGIRRTTFTDFKIHNSLAYQDLDHADRKFLTAYYEPYNDRLYQFLGMNFGWDNSTSQEI